MYCTSLKIKLTSLRKEVLYILWQAEKPLKAYEVLDSLLLVKPNSKPTTVYRTLLFFLSEGVLHKIEHIQSYMLCNEPEKQLSSEVLMVCTECNQVIEIYNEQLRDLVEKMSNVNHFKLKEGIIELKGSCQRCSDFLSHAH